MASQGGPVSRAIAIVAVAALAVVVGVLAALALQRGEGTGDERTPSPIPTFTFGGDGAGTPSPTPSPSATGAPAALSGDAAQERFVAVDGSQLWRATAGRCAADATAVAPVVEYSTDNGETWQDVTPADARQVLNLAAFGEAGQGEVIAATGADCAPAALRTYTAGRAWESYPAVLAGSTYVAPTDRASVVAAGTPIAAPCPDARSARTSRTATGIVCSGTAYLQSGDSWTALTDGAVALDAVSGTIVVAHTSDACSGGVAVTRYTTTASSGTDLGCIDDVDASTPAALSMLDSDVVLWSAETISTLD